MKCIFTLALLLCSLKIYGDILGNFSNSLQLPGFIDFSSRSLVQNDPFNQRKYKDDLENRSPSEILAFYFRNGSFDKSEFEKILEGIKLKEKNELIAFCNINNSSDCSGEILEKWQKNEYFLAYNELKKLIPETINLSTDLDPQKLNEPDAALFLNHFFTTLEIWEALKRPDREIGKPSHVGRIVKLNVFSFLIGGNTFSIERENPEAANLLVPRDYRNFYPDQIFFSPEQLEALRKKGVDISKFNPPNSDIWHSPSLPIGDYDLTNYNRDSAKSLRHLFDEEFIEDLIDSEKSLDIDYVFDADLEITSPKLLGKIGGQDFIVKYATDRVAPYPKSRDLLNFFNALTNQTEAYTEKVVNNLLAAMGFTVEPTYFKKKVRLFISKNEVDFPDKLKKLLKEVISSNKPFNHAESAFKIIKTDDETGKSFTELHNVSLKKKNDDKTDMDISFFIRHGLGKHLKREHRALAFIQALLEDVDSRDQNDQIKLIPFTDRIGKIRYRPIALVPEMGASLGYGMPNFFSTELVTKVIRDRRGAKRINFNYRRFYPLPILKTVTISDAKWVMRLFGQLTYDQIYKSFETSGYPGLIADLMTRKLLGRRNQVMEALGLIGEKITDSQGNEVILIKEKEFSGSIAGYEEYFKKGYLDDPEDKLFPRDESPFKRYWSVSFNPTVGGKRIKASFKNIGELILGAANLGASGLLAKFKYDLFPILKEFEPVREFDAKINPICLGGQCFVQALSAGPLGLIPFTFVIDNPDKSSSKPFLIVNMFRIGVKASTKITPKILPSGEEVPTPSPAASFFSFSTTPLSTEIIGGVTAVKEFITVTGTDNLLTYSREFKKVIKTVFLLSHKKLRNFVEKLDVGQTLIISSYFSGELHAYENVAPAGFGAGIGGGFVLGLTNRVIFNKQENDQILAHWSKLTKKEFEILLQAKAYFGITVMGLSAAQDKARDRTFKFNSSDPEEMKYVMENLQSTTPTSIPDKFRYQERLLKSTTAKAQAGLWFFLDAKISSAKGEIILRDFITEEEKKENFRIIRITKSKPIGPNTVNYETIYKTSVDENSDVFVNVTSNFGSTNLTRDKLIVVLDRLKGLIPENFIPYDINSLGYFLGSVNIQTVTIIPQKGLLEFFTKAENQICSSFAQMNGYSLDECEKSVKPIPLALFLKDFKQAKRDFFNLINKDLVDRGEKLRGLNQILDIFSRFTRNHSMLTLVKKTISFENYYTNAALDADRFLGNTDSIFLESNRRGGFSPSFRHKVIDPAKQFELFSDDLVNSLGGVFFQFN